MLTHEMKPSRESFSSIASTGFSSLQSAYCTQPTMDLALQRQHCNCSMRTFEVLRTLHERSDNLQIPFDTVLAINKDVTARISEILSCHCVHDPASVMTLAAAIAKMSRLFPVF